MSAVRIVAISAGLSKPSSSRMLADALGEATRAALTSDGRAPELVIHDLRDHATDIMTALLTGFPSPGLRAVREDMESAAGVILVTPIYTAGISGLMKSFLDGLDTAAFQDLPVLIGATGGTARHSLAMDYATRPVLSYLKMDVLSTAVFAASEDWGGSGDEVKPLSARIDRAGSELAAAIERSQRRAPVDPLALEQDFASMLGALGTTPAP